MKYISLSLTFAAVSVLVNGATVEIRRNKHNNNNNGNSNGNGNSNNTTTTTTGNNNTTSSNNNGGGDSNPQTSLTLDPSVICTACTDDGQNPPVALQSSSLTSSNNFINFCDGKTLTNGLQVVGGSCNGVVIGDIIPSSNMPAAKITFPPNLGTFAADTEFVFKMNIQNMVTGNFVNADTNYYGAPQQLNGGIVVGHSHVTVQQVDSLTSTTPLDPTVFAFFKGINDPAVNGELSVNVTAGLPAGVYRFCTMNTSANHTPVMVAIAQHGHVDDCIYSTAVAGGGNGNGTDTSSSTSSATTSTDNSASTSSAADASSTSSAAGNGGGKNRGGRGGHGGRGRGGRGRRPQ
jgi:hypothetical protein